MKEYYPIQDIMAMHTTFANKVVSLVDKKKRFVHDPKERVIICEVKGALWGWKEKSRETYEEVFLNDFGRICFD